MRSPAQLPPTIMLPAHPIPTLMFPSFEKKVRTCDRITSSVAALEAL